ncbi:pyridoxamine 5'-phosphate oxidase family protein [Gordonibacter sp.]|uniref:pyridoxamine 5'-phosphate oxidase family protein n=1 Tax=Gordonibacter sp. TaxID=1968902 RepID=UPI002FC9B4CE
MTEYRMRYAERELSAKDAWGIFEAAEYCVASTVDADGMPYGVPISFVVMDGKLYFHTTNIAGHKLDNFAHDARICVTAAVDVEACFENDFMTSRYGSAMAFGRIRRVEDSVEVRHALVALCMKYLPDYQHEIGNAIAKDLAETAVWAVEADLVTGKAAHRLSK